MQFTSFPIVFQQYRGWSPSISGLAFIGLSVGSVLGLVLLGIDNARYAKKLKAAGGYLAPEERLIGVILGACLLPAGLFMYVRILLPCTTADEQVRMDCGSRNDSLDCAHHRYCPLWCRYRRPLPWYSGT
jgi:hypothetical protein